MEPLGGATLSVVTLATTAPDRLMYMITTRWRDVIYIFLSLSPVGRSIVAFRGVLIPLNPLSFVGDWGINESILLQDSVNFDVNLKYRSDHMCPM